MSELPSPVSQRGDRSHGSTQRQSFMGRALRIVCGDGRHMWWLLTITLALAFYCGAKAGSVASRQALTGSVIVMPVDAKSLVDTSYPVGALVLISSRDVLSAPWVLCNGENIELNVSEQLKGSLSRTPAQSARCRSPVIPSVVVARHTLGDLVLAMDHSVDRNEEVYRWWLKVADQ